MHSQCDFAPFRIQTCPNYVNVQRKIKANQYEFLFEWLEAEFK